MNETYILLVIFIVIFLFITLAVKWFFNDDDKDYVARNDYIFDDFYTRENKQ